MSFGQIGPSRRALLAAAALLPLAGCGGSSPRPGASPAPSSPRPGSAVRGARDASEIAPDWACTPWRRAPAPRWRTARTSVSRSAPPSRHSPRRRSFTGYPLSHLDKHVAFTRADVDSISPITEKHIASGMTIRQLCDAAIRYSDGTAGNLLMRDIGGPARLTAYSARSSGTPSAAWTTTSPN